jgi:hypothetical protein
MRGFSQYDAADRRLDRGYGFQQARCGVCGVDQGSQERAQSGAETEIEEDMMELIAFLLWFMPQKIRLAVASRIGVPYHCNSSDTTVWVVGKRTAFLARGKFTIEEIS